MTWLLDVATTSGTGTGSVTSSPAGINCGSSCNATYDDGTVVTLTATASTTSNFTGWNGCTPTATPNICTVTMSAQTNVRAEFTLKTYTLTVAVTGTGTVDSNPPGISCGPNCTKDYSHGTLVTLTPAPGAGQMFSTWGGACTGSGSCSVTMNQAQSVTATFIPQVVGVSVIKTGNGTVTSSPAGINCGATCNASYAIGTVVTLTAASDVSSDFTGWSGSGCSGMGTCVVTVAGATQVNANFALKTWKLDLTKAGNGSGTISSTPAGINCGPACTTQNATFNHGTMVLLSAASGAGSSFTGWSGACTGVSPCTVTMDQARNVTATFTLQTFAVTITKSGGTGTVTSNVGGINCGATCSATYNYGTVVTFTASPAAQVVFNSWAGVSCPGTGTCTLTVTAATNVIARFEPNELKVVLAGDGYGVVSSSPAGINGCGQLFGGGTCVASFNVPTTVTLTATPDNAFPSRLSTFAGWSGACSGTSPCTITMNKQTTVTANWDLRPNIAFLTTNRAADFGGLAGADTICSDTATAAGLNGSFKAFLSTSTVDAITRLGTASGWERVDGKPVANSVADVVAGKMFYPVRITPLPFDAKQDGVWTGTTANGVAQLSSCTNWTAATTSTTRVGDSSAIGIRFTEAVAIACNTTNRIYCFGTDRKATVSVTPPATRRYAFLSADAWVVSGGLANADAFCQTDATAAGLPGSYRALLPTTAASAASRFSTVGAVWTRTDGVPLTATAAGMFTTDIWDTSPVFNAAGAWLGGGLGVWGGSSDLATVGTLASTCLNWTSSSGTAAIDGQSGHGYHPSLFGTVPNGKCNSQSNRVVCLQQ